MTTLTHPAAGVRRHISERLQDVARDGRLDRLNDHRHPVEVAPCLPRYELINRVRQRIAAGAYDCDDGSDGRLNAAVDRMIERLAEQMPESRRNGRRGQK